MDKVADVGSYVLLPKFLNANQPTTPSHNNLRISDFLSVHGTRMQTEPSASADSDIEHFRSDWTLVY